MVAHAPLAVLAHETSPSIKLLDLLTNRYHLGIIRESSESGLEVELPASAHLHAGQRVRFAVGGEQALIARNEMRRAFVTNVSPAMLNRMSIQLALVPETAVA